MQQRKVGIQREGRISILVGMNPGVKCKVPTTEGPDIYGWGKRLENWGKRPDKAPQVRGV